MNEQGGTGFFYNFDNDTYLVTNEHVLRLEGKQPQKARIYLRDDEDVAQYFTTDITLVNDDGEFLWLEYPYFSDIDLAAIELDFQLDSVHEDNGATGSRALTKEQFVPDDVRISGGSSALVIGYPADFIDSNSYLPVIRDARIASPYEIPFEGEPFFITDAIMHPGTSGSPVISEPTMHSHIQGEGSVLSAPSSYFLGVHSAEFILSSELSDHHNTLSLNQVWHAQLVEEMLWLNNLSDENLEKLRAFWEYTSGGDIDDDVNDLLIERFGQDFVDNPDGIPREEEWEEIRKFLQEIIEIIGSR